MDIIPQAANKTPAVLTVAEADASNTLYNLPGTLLMAFNRGDDPAVLDFSMLNAEYKEPGWGILRRDAFSVTIPSGGTRAIVLTRRAFNNGDQRVSFTVTPHADLFLGAITYGLPG